MTISVEDHGIGLQAEDANRLLAAFYTAKANGTGIGLAISRSIIIQTHGSRLWAGSSRGRSAVFAFRLPAAKESAAA